MKKSLFALTLALAATVALADNSVSLNVDRVRNIDTDAVSQAQTLRVSKDAGQLNLGLQVRTSVAEAGGLGNSIEGTVGTKVGPVQVFGGVGHDNGANGVRGAAYQYGVLGASAGTKLGPVGVFGGVKTRVNWETNAPKQTLGFVGASYALTKAVSAEASFSRSYQDIREDAFGFGVKVAF